MKQAFFILFILSVFTLFAQDTIQVMQYNLLNYGNYYGDCNSSTNNVNTKNVHLRKIIQYVKPDIFTVNELSGERTYHQLILNNVLNINGETKYRKAVSFEDESTFLVNMLYYNSDKLALYHQDIVYASVRNINVYTLYYKAGDLAQTNDTIFLTCFVAHLKAGNDASDATTRAGMVANVINYIRIHELSDNLLFMGDFNLYSSSEQAYINMTYTYNGTRYFYDPVNREGHWNNNSSFEDVHTQSTHSGNTDCFSSGGLDDRFDFIMASSSVLNGNKGIHMINDSYHALGNDGQHFNKNITDEPENTSAPADIIDALYGMSDHLPVLTQLKVDASLGIESQNQNIVAVRFPNPNNGHFNMEISLKDVKDFQLSVFDLYGRLQYQKPVNAHQIFVKEPLNLSYLSDGIYLLMIEDSEGNKITRKFFVKK